MVELETQNSSQRYLFLSTLSTSYNCIPGVFMISKSKEWFESTTKSMSISLNKLWNRVEDQGAWCAAVHEVTESGRT